MGRQRGAFVMNVAATILVVEDEQLIAEDIRQRLNALGYSAPHSAATAAQAFQRAARFKPQLILMDIRLKGGTDGIAAASEIRRRLGIPVVYITSLSDDPTLARAAETGPYGFLVKPFDDRELRAVIEVALKRRAFEVELQVRERRFATTLDSIADAVVATDPHGIVTFLNAPATRATGWPGDEAIGKDVRDVIRLTDSEGHAVENPISVALGKAQVYRMPYATTLLPRTGRPLLVEPSASPIVDNDGQFAGGVVVLRDVTERAQLERYLAQRDRRAVIGAMAAEMGEEINDPLTYLVGNLGFSSRVLREVIGGLDGLRVTDDDGARFGNVLVRLAEIGKALLEADDAVERMQSIVLGLKKFMPPDAHEVKLVELSDVLDASLRLMAYTLPTRARLQKEYEAVPAVEASEAPLTQVFLNLFLHASGAVGGTDVEQHETHVRTHTNERGEAAVEIHSTRSGVSSNADHPAFDRNFGNEPRAPQLDIDVAMCKSIVQSFGGTLVTESVPDRGRTFRVTFPPASREGGALRASGRTSKPLRRGRVLLVNDEEAFASGIARMLRFEHEVTVEADARTALARIARGERYDAIFCDLNAPTISGIDMYRTLVSSAPELAARLVFMTSRDFSAQARPFLDKVPNVSIDKPVSLDSIRTIISDLVASN